MALYKCSSPYYYYSNSVIPSLRCYKILVHEPMFSCPNTKASSLRTICPRTNVFLPLLWTICPRTNVFLPKHQGIVTMDHLSLHQWHRHYRPLVHEPMFSCPNTKASSLRTICLRTNVFLPLLWTICPRTNVFLPLLWTICPRTNVFLPLLWTICPRTNGIVITDN